MLMRCGVQCLTKIYRLPLMIAVIIKPAICIVFGHCQNKNRKLYSIFPKKMPLLRIRGASTIACHMKNLYIKPVILQANGLPVNNYFFLSVSIVVVILTVVSLTTVAVSFVTTFVVSLVFVSSVFLSPSLLQATKAIDTTANAKIAFFILFCLNFKIII